MYRRWREAVRTSNGAVGLWIVRVQGESRCTPRVCNINASVTKFDWTECQVESVKRYVSMYYSPDKLLRRQKIGRCSVIRSLVTCCFLCQTASMFHYPATACPWSNSTGAAQPSGTTLSPNYDWSRLTGRREGFMCRDFLAPTKVSTTSQERRSVKHVSNARKRPWHGNTRSCGLFQSSVKEKSVKPVSTACQLVRLTQGKPINAAYGHGTRDY